jgi:hypothetical protein
MSGTPRFKVYRNGEYVAAVKYPEDAAALVAGGGEIRDGAFNRRVVYRADETTADSYDEVAGKVWRRVREMREEEDTR